MRCGGTGSLGDCQCSGCNCTGESKCSCYTCEYENKLKSFKKEVNELISMVECGTFEPEDWTQKQCDLVKKMMKDI